jgi:hypothetical protein
MATNRLREITQSQSLDYRMPKPVTLPTLSPDIGEVLPRKLNYLWCRRCQVVLACLGIPHWAYQHFSTILVM